MTALGHLVAEAPAAVLLPARRAEEAARVRGPLRLVDSLDLGTGPEGTLHYLLVEDGRAQRYGVPAVVTPSGLRRAVAGDGASAALLADGTAAADEERELPVDQTNELVVVGPDRVVKWYLHPSPEADVALQRLDLLAAAGFDGTPAVVARRRAADGSLIAVVMEFLPGAEDGWDWLVGDVRTAATHGGVDALTPLDALGELVAGMHVALASAGVGLAGERDAAGWLRGALADADAAQLPAELDAAVRERLAPIGAAAGSPVIPIHGDLHVGQVLRVPGPRYYVIDFDGNPMADVESRVTAAPAARDVAGMLASIDHVGRVVIHRTDGLDEQGRSRVLAWINEAQRRFLARYVSVLDSAGAASLLDTRLLLPFMVQQECREYAYAARYLPHWRYVPDAALPAVLAKEAL